MLCTTFIETQDNVLPLFDIDILGLSFSNVTYT